MVDELLGLVVRNKKLTSNQIFMQMTVGGSYGLEKALTLRLICLTMLVTFFVRGAQAAGWQETWESCEAQVSTTRDHEKTMSEQRAL